MALPFAGSQSARSVQPCQYCDGSQQSPDAAMLSAVSTHANAWLAGVDGCPAGWIAASARAGRGEVRVRVVPHFADVLAAPEAPAIDRGRYSDRAAGARRPWRARGRARGAAAPRRAAILGVLGAVAGRAGCARTIAMPAGSRSRPRSRRARFRSSCSCWRRRSARWMHACAPMPRSRARVFEVHPEVAFWRLNGELRADEPKKVKGRATSRASHCAATVLVSGPSGGRGNGAAAKGAGPDDVLSARLRRDRATHPAGCRAAFSRSARARRVRVADGDLGMTVRVRGAGHRALQQRAAVPRSGIDRHPASAEVRDTLPGAASMPSRAAFRSDCRADTGTFSARRSRAAAPASMPSECR